MSPSSVRASSRDILVPLTNGKLDILDERVPLVRDLVSTVD
jgi:hypothetical protein